MIRPAQKHLAKKYALKNHKQHLRHEIPPIQLPPSSGTAQSPLHPPLQSIGAKNRLASSSSASPLQKSHPTITGA